MNGGVIGLGGLNPLMGHHKSGVWKTNDPELNLLKVSIPTSGLINHWPLTSDANDIIGSSNLTNNNTVTFSSEGAVFLSASSQFLSATITWPTLFTWALEFKISSGNYIYMGNCNNGGAYPHYIGIGRWGNDTVKLIVSGTSTGAGVVLNLDMNYNICDGNWHTLASWGFNNTSSESETAFTCSKMFIDGYLVGGAAVYPAITLNTSFSIGRPGALTSGYGNGNIRNFRAYNRHLSHEEILSMAP